MSSVLTSRRIPFRTIGARLTFWSAGVMLCVCVLLCGTLYTGMFYALRGEVDRFLEGEVHEFMVTVNEHPNDDVALEEAIRRELGGRTRRDLAFRLFDEAGDLIVTSEPKDPLAGLWAPPAGPEWESPSLHYETVQLATHPHAFRLCSLRVETLDRRTCIAQAGYMLDRMATSLALFRRVCAVAMVVAVLAAVAAGRFLARRSLRPMQTVTETARRIGADSLTERIPLAGTDDELDQLARTLNNMLERIEHHVRQVQQFTADASHELRSPLAALRGSAELALTHPRSAEEFRQVIEESIEHYDRLARVAEDLLLLTRADAGDQVLHCEPVRFDSAVRDVVDLYAPLAQECGIDLTFSNPAEIRLEADGTRLRQLIGNLIDNAIRYTEAGGQVTVSLAQANGVACLSVADTGVGIPAEHLSRVFDRFYRVDRARSAKHKGAGLGLAICRMI
ncbi:MAG: heavy metal sensor histidine kinase, partial [Planctomycetes bacterium]|nr:heavy metal sensor histidine kinase [Planctomycetota bacterium]